MGETSSDKAELEKAIEEFLEQESKKEAVNNNGKHVKKRKHIEENIFYVNYPCGSESS